MKVHKTNWEFIFSSKARQQFKKLEPQVQKRVLVVIKAFQSGDLDVMQETKQLSGQLHPLRSYRIGVYRLILEVRKEQLILMAVAIAHRRDVYQKIS